MLLIFIAGYLLLETLKIKNPIKKIIIQHQLTLIFSVALISTFGSLILSFYFKLAPCDLCWYQRIFLFPLPLIAFIGLIIKDIRARLYVFVLSCIGIVFALYHSFLQMQVFKKDTVFCNPTSLIDCATPDFVHFGFVTIPIMSLTVFLFLLILSYSYEDKIN